MNMAMGRNRERKEGFTLVELLVVVAIIAILAAVSIAIFTGKLNEAKEATDAANVRAAKAVGAEAVLSEQIIVDGNVYDLTKGANYLSCYYLEDGTLSKYFLDEGNITPNTPPEQACKGLSKKNKGSYLVLTITWQETGAKHVTTSWIRPFQKE